jgi:hypothetical protein
MACCEVIAWFAGARQTAQPTRVRGQAGLLDRDGMFLPYAVVEVGDIPSGEPTDHIGVGLGHRNIVAGREGDHFCGALNAKLRRRHAGETVISAWPPRPWVL